MDTDIQARKQEEHETTIKTREYQGDRVKVRTRRPKKRRVHKNQYSKTKNSTAASPSTQQQRSIPASLSSASSTPPVSYEQLITITSADTVHNNTNCFWFKSSTFPNRYTSPKQTNFWISSYRYRAFVACFYPI